MAYQSSRASYPEVEQGLNKHQMAIYKNYWCCHEGHVNCKVHLPPATEAELKTTRAKQVINPDDMKAFQQFSRNVQKAVLNLTLAQIADNCRKLLYRHPKIVEIHRSFGKRAQINVTPRFGSIHFEINASTLRESRKALLDITNVVKQLLDSVSPSFPVTLTASVIYIGLFGAIGLACLAYGLWSGNNVATVIGAAITGAVGGAAFASPVIGIVEGVLLGWSMGLISGAVAVLT